MVGPTNKDDTANTLGQAGRAWLGVTFDHTSAFSWLETFDLQLSGLGVVVWPLQHNACILTYFGLLSRMRKLEARIPCLKGARSLAQYCQAGADNCADKFRVRLWTFGVTWCFDGGKQTDGMQVLFAWTHKLIAARLGMSCSKHRSVLMIYLFHQWQSAPSMACANAVLLNTISQCSM